MFAENCSLVALNRKEFREMMIDATIELRRRGLEWKKERDGVCELESWAWRL